MSDELKREIRKLRQELLIARQANSVKNTLKENREKLETYLQGLLDQIEEETLKAHKTSDISDQALNEVEIKRKTMQEIKEKKQEMDAKLDEYEFFSNEMMGRIELQLIDSILRCYPEEKSAYEALRRSLDQMLAGYAYLKELALLCDEMTTQLSAIVVERQKVKGPGMLRYLVGLSPNFKISRSIETVGKIAEKLLSEEIERLKALEQFRVFAEALEPLLASLADAAKGRWNFQKIDRIYIPAETSLRQAIDRVNAFYEQTADDIERTNNALEKWIENFPK